MRSAMALPLIAALTLSACGSSGADKNNDGTITKEEAAREAAGGSVLAMLPGEWEQTIQFTEIEMPGMPAGVQDMMKRQMGSGITVKHCLSDADVAKPDADFFGGQRDNNCTYHEFDRSGSRMTIKLTCSSPEGGTSDMAMNGEFGADHFTLNMENKVSGGPSPMMMKGTVSGKRIGDCPAS